MSVLVLLGSWFILSIIVGPIVGTIIRSTTLDEDNINN